MRRNLKSPIFDGAERLDRDQIASAVERQTHTARLGSPCSSARGAVTTDEAPGATQPPRTSSPARFANIGAARAFCAEFFDHCNTEHRHSGIGLHTPADVHFGLADVVREKRQGFLDAACAVLPSWNRNEFLLPEDGDALADVMTRRAERRACRRGPQT